MARSPRGCRPGRLAGAGWPEGFATYGPDLYSYSIYKRTGSALALDFPRSPKVKVLAETYLNLELSAFSESCVLHALEISMFNFTCVFESGHRGRYGFLQSSIFVLCNSMAHLSLPLLRSGRPSVKKRNRLSLLRVFFEIGHPGRADLLSKNEVDVQLYVCF